MKIKLETRRLRIVAALVVVPALVLTGLVIKHEIALEKAQTWRVKISGYDPRNLMYGHYLSFRFDWDWKPAKERTCKDEKDCCLCLEGKGTKDAPAVPKVSLASCAPAASTACASRVRATTEKEWQKTGVLNPAAAQRYYIPEQGARTLEKALRSRDREAALDLKVTPSGAYMLGDLYIDGEPWRDWAGKNAGKK